MKSFYTFSRLVKEVFSAQFSQPSSYLQKNASALEDISELLPDAIDSNLEKWRHKNLYVFHADQLIAWLGARIITTITGKHAGEISADESLPDGANDAVFLLSPAIHPSGTNVIPVYKLATEKRDAALSNLYKLLQQEAGETGNQFEKFVIFDLETTDKDTSTCDIVEIAAVRVEQGKVVAQFEELVKPPQPITEGAQAVHHISNEDVHNKPRIEEIWTRFRNFIGNDLLIAHNGFNFDFPIIDRMARKIDGARLSNLRYDSLILAQKLYPQQSNSIDALIARFGLDGGNRHRALDDVMVLAEILNILQNIRTKEEIKISHEKALDCVALGNLIENKLEKAEDRIFFIAGALELLRAGNETVDIFSYKFGYDMVTARTKVEQRLNEYYPNARLVSRQDYAFQRLMSLTEEYNELALEEAISKFLSYVAINSSQDMLQSINAVSLLTYHAAKGLEFDKVIILGMENGNMPGFHATRESEEDDRPVEQKLEEQRRLMYVGITRAKSEVILTTVTNRDGYERTSSDFLTELMDQEK